MFFKKRDIVEELLKEAIADAKIIAHLGKQAKCNDCGAYIDEINAVKREAYSIYGTTNSTMHYCNKCKKPYTKKVEPVYDGVIKYFAEIEVDRNGVPVGYTKKK